MFNNPYHINLFLFTIEHFYLLLDKIYIIFLSLRDKLAWKTKC